MTRHAALILALLMATPFLILAALAGLGMAIVIIGFDLLEDRSWHKRVPGQSTGAEEEV